MRFLEAQKAARSKDTPVLMHNTDWVRIYRGLAENYANKENIGLILTNPYGNMPFALRKTPMIVHQWVHRFEELRQWCYTDALELIGTWNDGKEGFWVGNLPVMPVDIARFKPEPGGWYPTELVRTLLNAYNPPHRPLTLWDGFMGRGTVGKVAVEDFGMKYVGVEELDKHIRLAIDYVGNAKP